MQETESFAHTAEQEVDDDQGTLPGSSALREEVVDSLRQLKSLADEGILTIDEYETRRRRLVDLL